MPKLNKSHECEQCSISKPHTYIVLTKVYCFCRRGRAEASSRLCVCRMEGIHVHGWEFGAPTGSKLRCINVIMDLRMALVVAVTSAIIAIMMSKIIQEVTVMLQEGITTTYGMILERWICGPKSPEETPNLVKQQKEPQELGMTTSEEADVPAKQGTKRDPEDGARATAIEIK